MKELLPELTEKQGWIIGLIIIIFIIFTSYLLNRFMERDEPNEKHKHEKKHKHED